MDTAENHAVGAAAVVQNELQKLLALFHGHALFDLHGAEIRLGEGLKVHKLLEQRLDLHFRDCFFAAFSAFLASPMGFMVGI